VATAMLRLSAVDAMFAWGRPSCAAGAHRHVQLLGTRQSLHALGARTRSLPATPPASPAHTVLLSSRRACPGLASLYPSLYRAHNMCYTTLLHADDAAALDPAQVTTTTAGAAGAPRGPACPLQALWLLRNLAMVCSCWGEGRPRARVRRVTERCAGRQCCVMFVPRSLMRRGAASQATSS